MLQYDPFERFSIRLRWDERYAINGRLPIRTETWSFFNKSLNKYASEVTYYETGNDNNTITIEEVVYFQNNKQVWTESKTKNCLDESCHKVLSDVKQHTEQSFEALVNEVQNYRKLTLIPTD